MHIPFPVLAFRSCLQALICPLNPCFRIFLGYTSNLVRGSTQKWHEETLWKDEVGSISTFLPSLSTQTSAGTREHIRYLVQNRMVDAVVTTAGGIEEDFIKCLAPTYVGDFALKGKEMVCLIWKTTMAVGVLGDLCPGLRRLHCPNQHKCGPILIIFCLGSGAELRMQGLNRIGNMLVPNSNYVKFEEWIM